MRASEAGADLFGFLVRTTVQVDSVEQLGVDDEFVFGSNLPALLNDRPPLVLRGAYVGNGAAFPIVVVDVHQRSLSGIEGRIRIAETAIPEADVPSQGLGVNRYALVNGDFVFETVVPPGGGAAVIFTVADAGGCSCEQIIDRLGLGQGHVKKGCSWEAMEAWIASLP